MQDAEGANCPACGLHASSGVQLSDDDSPAAGAVVRCSGCGTVAVYRWRPATERDLRLSEQAAQARATERAAVMQRRHGLATWMHLQAARLDAMAERRGRQTIRLEVAR